MHRQSLGSPAPKLQCHAVLFTSTGLINTDNNITSDQLTSSSTDGDKPQKPSPSSRLVHLIPILTFFCFLILYLFSHDPSSIELGDGVGGGSVMIRSVRSLQQQERRRFHRKFRH